MKIAIDCDSAAIELKKVLVEHLKEKQVDFTDLDYLKDHDVDYPDIGFNLAREIAAGNYDRGILLCGTVIANDDAPSAPKDQRDKRRGVAGEILMWKVAGAKAAMGGSLDEVVAVAQKAIDNTRSIGVGTDPCTIPAVGHPNFSIEDGKMELGIGHHGEPGMKVVPLQKAGEMAGTMVDVIILRPAVPVRR